MRACACACVHALARASVCATTWVCMTLHMGVYDVAQGIRVCNMLEGGSTPLHTPAELQEMGFSVITYPLSALYAATRSLINVYGTLAKQVVTLISTCTAMSIPHQPVLPCLINVYGTMAKQVVMVGAPRTALRLCERDVEF